MGTNNEVMKSLNFGVEIEMTGITRCEAAKVIAFYFGTCSWNSQQDYGYGSFSAKDWKGRVWKCMKDGSITPDVTLGGMEPRQVEIVTPILQYEDIADLQEIVRKLRKAGAIVNRSCGIHIHIGAEKFTPGKLKNIANIFSAHEDLLYEALEVDRQHRDVSYCEKTSKSFIEEINKGGGTKTDYELAWAWYEGQDVISRQQKHYDSSRYRGLNLHSFWQKGTIEFRLFNSTLHAGKIKAYIQLCLAIAQQALTQKRATYKKKETTNKKYTLRCWMLRMGLIGEEFKTCRTHLLGKIPGNSAWRYGSQRQAA